jgi:membrane protein YqaA with SNARE-associated domain
MSMAGDRRIERRDGPLRRWVRRWTAGPRAYVAAVMIGLSEAVIPFITPEVLLVPMLASAGKRVWLLALFPVLGNLIAAIVLYTLGASLADPVVQPLVAWLGGEAEYNRAVEWLQDNGFLALFLLDLVPIPVQLVFLAAGVANYSIVLFLIAIAISRSLRYLLIAAIVRLIGGRAREWLEAHQLEFFLASFALFVGLSLWVFFA